MGRKTGEEERRGTETRVGSVAWDTDCKMETLFPSTATGKTETRVGTWEERETDSKKKMLKKKGDALVEEVLDGSLKGSSMKKRKRMTKVAWRKTRKRARWKEEVEVERARGKDVADHGCSMQAEAWSEVGHLVLEKQ